MTRRRSFTEQFLEVLYPPARIAAEQRIADTITGTLERRLGASTGVEPAHPRKETGSTIRRRNPYRPRSSPVV
jgi:hypothetical protein